MEKTKVTVGYEGFCLYQQWRKEAKDAGRTTLFPHTKDSVTFDLMNSRPETVIIFYVCPECREALHKWELGYDDKN